MNVSKFNYRCVWFRHKILHDDRFIVLINKWWMSNFIELKSLNHNTLHRQSFHAALPPYHRVLNNFEPTTPYNQRINNYIFRYYVSFIDSNKVYNANRWWAALRCGGKRWHTSKLPLSRRSTVTNYSHVKLYARMQRQYCDWIAYYF